MNRQALIIGINQYTTDPLAYCVNDANSVADIMQLPEYGFACTLLTDSNATTRNIKNELQRVLTEGTDVALFYFAGHGARTEHGAFLLTADFDGRADDGVDIELISRMIKAYSHPDSAVVVVLDCCHSGTLQMGHGQHAVAMKADDLTPYVKNFSDRRALIAACMDNQLADEIDELEHGIFTNHFLDAVSGEAANAEGDITVNAIYDYIAGIFETLHAQRPVFRGDLAGRIVLGNGLMKREQKSEITELQSVERLAEEHLQSLQSIFAKSMANRHEWHQNGYRDVCKQATPILQWFTKRKNEHPKLSSQPRFKAAEEELFAKVRFLSNFEPGINCEAGKVQSHLGVGSFGTVWKIETSHGPQAMKVYHGYDLGIKEKVGRFRNGYSAMRRLEHPLIVRVHSLFECPLSFSMDFIEGANFRNWVGAIEAPQDVVTLLMRISDTIQHAHSKGVLHRDIKPENIIMRYDQNRETWEPFLTDFDLSWFSTASLQTKDALGTVFYAAPEQLAKPGSIGARAPLVDVFSFGQVMFYALTSSDPTPLELADNVKALKIRLANWPLARPSELMVSLYEACTQRDPLCRPKSMSAVSKSLYEILLAFREYDIRPLTKDEFVKEVQFAIVGLDSTGAAGEFMSPAGQTSIVTHLAEDFCTIRFSLHRQPLVDNVPDFKSGRGILNQRVDSILRDHHGCVRKSGTGGAYEILVNVPRKPLTANYASEIRIIATAVLGVLEKG
jgi:serine/threonine protein kinase